jgi:hypothetical protein
LRIIGYKLSYIGPIYDNEYDGDSNVIENGDDTSDIHDTSKTKNNQNYISTVEELKRYLGKSELVNGLLNKESFHVVYEKRTISCIEIFGEKYPFITMMLKAYLAHFYYENNRLPMASKLLSQISLKYKEFGWNEISTILLKMLIKCNLETGENITQSCSSLLETINDSFFINEYIALIKAQKSLSNREAIKNSLLFNIIRLEVHDNLSSDIKATLTLNSLIEIEINVNITWTGNFGFTNITTTPKTIVKKGINHIELLFKATNDDQQYSATLITLDYENLSFLYESPFDCTISSWRRFDSLNVTAKLSLDFIELKIETKNDIISNCQLEINLQSQQLTFENVILNGKSFNYTSRDDKIILILPELTNNETIAFHLYLSTNDPIFEFEIVIKKSEVERMFQETYKIKKELLLCKSDILLSKNSIILDYQLTNQTNFPIYLLNRDTLSNNQKVFTILIKLIFNDSFHLIESYPTSIENPKLSLLFMELFQSIYRLNRTTRILFL